MALLLAAWGPVVIFGDSSDSNYLSTFLMASAVYRIYTLYSAKSFLETTSLEFMIPLR